MSHECISWATRPTSFQNQAYNDGQAVSCLKHAMEHKEIAGETIY